MMHLLFLTLASLFHFTCSSNQNYSVINVPIYGNSADGYYIALNIGSPPQELNILVDTGSSNLAIATNDNANISNYFHIDQSKSFQNLSEAIRVQYTEGSWDGNLGTDIVSFRNVFHIRANLACIMSSQNFFSNNSNWQGILGLAFNEIAKPNPSFVSFFDILKRNVSMNNIFSISLCGNEGSQGQLVFGGISPKLYHGEVLYVPLLREWYYEIALIDIAIGDSHWPKNCQQLNEDKTIVDSGTSDLRLPEQVFLWFVRTLWMHANVTVPNSPIRMDDHVFCLLHQDLSSVFPLLILTLYKEGKPIRLNISPELYMRQVVENSVGQKCYKLAVTASDKGTVIGAAILEGFYVVFDREKKAVGFGNSTCLRNGSISAGWVTLDAQYDGANRDCVFMREGDESNSILNVTAYILAAVCVICFIPLLVMLLHWIWHHLMCFRADSESSGLLESYR